MLGNWDPKQGPKIARYYLVWDLSDCTQCKGSPVFRCSKGSQVWFDVFTFSKMSGCEWYVSPWRFSHAGWHTGMYIYAYMGFCQAGLTTRCMVQGRDAHVQWMTIIYIIQVAAYQSWLQLGGSSLFRFGTLQGSNIYVCTSCLLGIWLTTLSPQAVWQVVLLC